MRAILCLLFFSVATLCADPKLEELKTRVCAILPTIDGWCSKEKALSFIDLVVETKPQVCVEIGVFGGASLFPVAMTLKYLGSGVIIGIDPWDKIECIKDFDPIEDKAHLDWWGKVNLDLVYISYLNVIKRYALSDYCITMRTTSEKAISEIDEIDILYIDGNHSEESSKRDVGLYLPKVRPGGYIWFDDCLWTETQAAIDMLLDACDAVKLIEGGSCILFKKR